VSDVPRTLGGGRWRTLLLLVANGVAQAVAAVGVALAAERVFQMLANPATGSDVVGPAMALAAAAVAMAALRGRERVDAERLGQAYTHRLRLHLFAHLTAMSPRTVQARSQGATSLRFIGDLTMVRRWVSRGLARLVVAGTMTAGTVVALIFVSPMLALTIGVVIAAGSAATLAQANGVRSTTRGARRRRARLAGNVTEKIGAVGVVQVHGAVERERRQVRRQSLKLRDAMVTRAGRLGRLDAIVEMTASAATGAVLVVGVIAGITAPTVAGSMVVVGLLVPQLRSLGRVQEYWQGKRVADEAISRFLARPTLQTAGRGAGVLADGPGRLELLGVSVDGALVDIKAVAEPGQITAVVGPNGAGKSTLLAVIAQIVEPDDGVVRLDGQDLATVALDDIRGVIGIVAADLPLLRGTLRDNLTYRCPDADPEEINAVVEQCELTELVESFPNGLDKRINEGGRDLSSGQRQRVLLARAVLGAPRVLLLDEADANLDPSTSAVVDRVLRRYAGTALVVTHRRERLVVADAIWHLDDGRLVASGPAAAELNEDGPTAQLFEHADTRVGER